MAGPPLMVIFLKAWGRGGAPTKAPGFLWTALRQLLHFRYVVEWFCSSRCQERRSFRVIEIRKGELESSPFPTVWVSRPLA